MNSIGQGISAVTSSVTSWAKQPFTSSMGLTGWGLFVGLIIALAVSWNFVLRDVKGVV